MEMTEFSATRFRYLGVVSHLSVNPHESRPARRRPSFCVGPTDFNKREAMRILSSSAKKAIQKVIDAHIGDLHGVLGFVSAEPGFPIINGRVHRETAILVFVAHKKPETDLLQEDRAPRQLDNFPVAVLQADPLRQLNATKSLAAVAAALTASVSGLTYKRIAGNPIDKPLEVTKPFLCHVGPDAGWPVLKPFIEATRKTLSVAMYDFNADYIATTFIDTVRNYGLRAILTWDDGMTAPETAIRARLKTKLKKFLDAGIVRCGASRRFASAYHEKVVVRDSDSFWLSSGNWSTRSQPNIDPLSDSAAAHGMYGKGNREWHVIVEDKALAARFEQYIRHDLAGSKEELAAGDKSVALGIVPPADVRFPDLFVPIQELVDQALFAMAVAAPVAPEVLPKTPRKVKVQPLLTPDNYVKRILELLRTAKQSVYLQYAYITYTDKPVDADFTELLGELAAMSYQPGLDMRIIVGSNGAADSIRQLVQAGFNDAVFRHQRNIHNKGIVVDGKVVLVSSANWSGDGVLRNRDAGLIIRDEEVAAYYQRVFVDDWNSRANAVLQDDPPVLIAAAGEAVPAGMVRMSWRDYYG
jgi:phosphatidylserine/phosphatidylglycerophosphate/cardiolipin synthase-like enzyme